MVEEVEYLDELSNGMLAATKAGQLDEAERLYRLLVAKYPNEIDPLERYAELCEARGDFATAAIYFRRSVDYARSHEGFDSELIDEWIRAAERCEAAQRQDPTDPAATSPGSAVPAR